MTRISASAPNSPSAYHAIATLVFRDQVAFETAMAAAEPVFADIPRFTDATPRMQVGEVVG